MKRFITSIVVMLTLLLTQFAIADPITIKFSHVVTENTPKGRMANKFRDLVAERLGEKVEVEVYPNSQLFGDNKVLEAMLLGDVQLAAPSLSKFQKYNAQLLVFDLPFLFNDITAVNRFQQSPVGQGLLTSLQKKGYLGLGYLHNGMKQLSANTPLRTPEDADGLKFRIQSSDVLAAQFKAVGGVPVKKPFSEVFTLMQTKAVDGSENPWSNIYSKKFFEVQDYITESNHGILGYMVIVAAEFWNNLPENIRITLKEAMDEAIAYGNEIAGKQATKDRKKIIDSGRTTVVELTTAERQQWVDAMKPVWKKFEDKIGKDLIESALRSNAK